MKKVIYALILLVIVVSGLVVALQNNKKEPAAQIAPKPLTAAAMNAERKKWEATPAGIHFNEWKASPAGKKVLAGAAKIRNQVRDTVKMEAVVTSLSLPEGARLGFGVMVKMNGEEYILNFSPEKPADLQQLKSLKVNDQIIIKSHFVSYAPKYTYAIVTGNYVERNSKIIYKRVPRKGGC